LIAISAHAAILIQDDFTRPIPTPLAGSTAVPIGGTWVAGSQTANGLANVTYHAINGDVSYQSVTLLASSTYQLTVDMEALGQREGGIQEHWLGFGFGGVVGSTSSASILLRNNGEAVAYQTGFVGIDLGSPGGNFMVELNTSATFVGSTIKYFRNSVQFASGTIDATGVNRVFLQNIGDMLGNYDNFVLTGPPVPEPSSALLGVVGLLGLAIRRRR
jgi:MYXO-CTERM domain-containing protein